METPPIVRNLPNVFLMEKKILSIPVMSIIGIIVKILNKIKQTGRTGRNPRTLKKPKKSLVHPIITRVVLPILIVLQKNL